MTNYEDTNDVVHHLRFQAALDEAVNEEAAFHAFEEHFEASAEDPYFEDLLHTWLTAWRKALAYITKQPAAGDEVEYEYEVWQHDDWQAGGREADYASAQSEANHYAMMYAQDGPVEVRIYEKRMLSTAQYPAAPSEESEEAGVEPLLDSLIRAAYDDGDNEREEFSERVKAARASVVAYVQSRDAGDRQPAEGGERDWLEEAMDEMAERRMDALEVGSEGGLQAEIERLRKMHQDAYQRGLQAGSKGLREMYDAVQAIKRQDAWGNAQLTEALMEAEERAERAEAENKRLREALKDIRSRSAMNWSMRLDPFARIDELGNIHQIADAALAKENKA